LLLLGAALVVVIRYAAAFYASDVGEIVGATSEVIAWFMAISGIGMGFLVVFGQSYAFDGWRRSLPKAGQRIAWRFVLLTLVCFLLILMDVAILVPFTVSRIRHESISDVLGEWDWLWSVSVNIAPALLLAGVGLGNQVVSTTQTETTQSDRKVTDNLPRSDWRKVRKQLTDEQVRELASMSGGAIAYRYGVDERTARNWRNYAQKEISK
jgi:MFS family permease